MSRLILLLMIPFTLGACVAPIALGVGAAAGIAATSEGGVEGSITDVRIEATINDLWFRHDVEMFRKLNLTVDQGRVLLTGVVQKTSHRVEAVRLAWKAIGVKQVINEIKVAETGGVTGFGRDTWITTRLRAALTLDRAVRAINYTIDTVQGTVYIMGVARNQAELNRVIETARTIPDVKQVVSYVKMSSEAVQSSAPVYEEQPQGAGSANNAPLPIQPQSDNYGAPASQETWQGGGSGSLVPPPVESAPLN
ncbi:MAG: BON domain-containing protein [Alphaproteobacteria bacterium]